MSPAFKVAIILGSLVAALLYGAPGSDDFWTKIASGLVIVAVSIVLNYSITSRTARLKVAEEIGIYKADMAILKQSNSDMHATMQRMLQELGNVQGQLSRIDKSGG